MAFLQSSFCLCCVCSLEQKLWLSINTRQTHFITISHTTFQFLECLTFEKLLYFSTLCVCDLLLFGHINFTDWVLVKHPMENQQQQFSIFFFFFFCIIVVVTYFSFRWRKPSFTMRKIKYNINNEIVNIIRAYNIKYHCALVFRCVWVSGFYTKIP